MSCLRKYSFHLPCKLRQFLWCHRHHQRIPTATQLREEHAGTIPSRIVLGRYTPCFCHVSHSNAKSTSFLKMINTDARVVFTHPANFENFSGAIDISSEYRHTVEGTTCRHHTSSRQGTFCGLQANNVVQSGWHSAGSSGVSAQGEPIVFEEHAHVYCQRQN